jgi:alkylation response protein AidB-like acyl-CoA dehydrogenase
MPAALAVLNREPPALDERLRLTGRARFVPHAQAARRLLLRAAGPDGDPVLLLLAAPRAGMVLRRHDEISRGDLYEVALEQAAAGEAEVLLRGAPAAAALERVGWALRLRQAAYLVGMAQGALDATMTYVRQRQAFGRRLASFQALAFRIAALHVRVEATRLLVRSVACRAADEDVRLAATQAHAVAAALATDSAAEGVQMHGAVGITDRSIVQRFYRHASVERVRLGRPADLLDEAAGLFAERARSPEAAPVEARR